MPLKQHIGAYCGGKPSLYLRLYSPHHRLRRSCLAQVDLVLRSAILHRKCKIAKLMCAQKPHRGYLHNAHIRPEGEASLKGSALAINYAASRVSMRQRYPICSLRPQRVNARRLFCCYFRAEGGALKSEDFLPSVRVKISEISHPFSKFIDHLADLDGALEVELRGGDLHHCL